jgi:hypothetical protein
MRYFTVRDPSAQDISAAYRDQQGTDDAGTNWALLKFRDSDPLPSWDGTAIELMDDEWQIATQSSLYQSGLGPIYREAATALGTEIVEGFISDAAGLPTALADKLLGLLFASALAGNEGFVPLLRYQAATTAPIPSIGWTPQAQASIVATIDAWLAKFPAQASQLPLATPSPQMQSLSEADNGAVLGVAAQAVIVSAASSAFTLDLPLWESQCERIDRPVYIENLSSFDVDLRINTADVGVAYATIGGTVLTLAGGERATLRTALDGASRVWVQVTT